MLSSFARWFPLCCLQWSGHSLYTIELNIGILENKVNNSFCFAQERSSFSPESPTSRMQANQDGRPPSVENEGQSSGNDEN